MSNPELRLAALSKLVDVKSADVNQRLSEEFRYIEGALRESTEHDELSQALKTLAVLVPRFHMATLPILEAFVRSVPTRNLTHGGSPIVGAKLRYRSPDSLIREAIEVAEKLRYVHTERVVDFLLEMSRSIDKEVRTKAERAFEALATLDLDVFYGQSPRGGELQARIVTHLTGLQNEVLLADASIILRALGRVLSPTMEGTSWSYQSVTIRRGSVSSDGGVAAMRAHAISLAKRIYGLDASVEHRKQVLRALHSATRREGPSNDPATSAMFERDAITVLELMRDLVATEALPLVQAIEHQAYWDYYHGASQVIKDKALEVRDALDAHVEYQIYKQLIGFEGIFGCWEDLSRSEEAWDYSDNKRREAARQYLEDINSTTYTKWRDRILEFSKTRSNDLAMFPVYYDFLQSIGMERSPLALELLADHVEVMTPFLIALMRGLWSSVSSADLEVIVKRWIERGQHLTAIAKSLYKVGALRLEVLAAVVNRAVVLDDREAIIQVMGVAASLYAEGATDAKAIFMQSLRELAKHDDASWASVIWFSRDFRALASSMEPGERAEVLATLISLPELDYQAEDVLYEIAKHDIQAVLDFLVSRLKYARVLAKQRGEVDVEFEPIPYQLTKLNELLVQVPEVLLTMLRSDFDKEASSMFSFRGGRLVKSAFPIFGAPLDGLLLQYVGAGDEDDIEFVIGVLHAYEGSASIQEVCKAIIKTVPEHSRIWSEVAAAIEATGVVSGELGMVHAIERKQQEISGWKGDQDERVRAFAQWLTEGLQSLIEQELQRADQGLALRKYRYGADKSQS